MCYNVLQQGETNRVVPQIDMEGADFQYVSAYSIINHSIYELNLLKVALCLQK